MTETITVKIVMDENECVNDLSLSCVLTLSNHSFLVNLMSVSIKSFDVIFSMYRLSPDYVDIPRYGKLFVSISPLIGPS